MHAAGIKGEQERERGRKGVNKNTKLPTPVAAERGRERERVIERVCSKRRDVSHPPAPPFCRRADLATAQSRRSEPRGVMSRGTASMECGRSIQHEISSLKGTPPSLFKPLAPSALSSTWKRDRLVFPQCLSGEDFLVGCTRRKQKVELGGLSVPSG